MIKCEDILLSLTTLIIIHHVDFAVLYPRHWCPFFLLQIIFDGALQVFNVLNELLMGILYKYYNVANKQTNWFS